MNFNGFFSGGRLRRIGFVVGHLGTFGILMMRTETSNFTGYVIGALIIIVGFSTFIFVDD